MTEFSAPNLSKGFKRELTPQVILSHVLGIMVPASISHTLTLTPTMIRINNLRFKIKFKKLKIKKKNIID